MAQKKSIYLWGSRKMGDLDRWTSELAILKGVPFFVPFSSYYLLPAYLVINLTIWEIEGKLFAVIL